MEYEEWVDCTPINLESRELAKKKKGQAQSVPPGQVGGHLDQLDV
jgi:hypothetical protein